MSLSHLLQIQALREALERAARASMASEERSLAALRDLQREEARAKGLEDAVRQLENRNADLVDENRRLRNLIGKASHDKDIANTELRTLLQEVRDLTPPDKTAGEKIKLRYDAA